MTELNEQAERKAFEKWASGCVDSLARGRNDGYAYADASRAWKAWQARAALAQQPAAQAAGLTDQQFIAAHGERLAAMLGIKEWWDIADRDARIKAALLSHAAPSGEPIYQLRKADGPWIDQTEASYRYNLSYGHAVRIVYAAPQPSAQQAEQPAAAVLDRLERVLDGYEDMPEAEQPAEEARGVNSKRIDLIARAIVDGYKEQYAVTSEQADALRDCIASELESLAAPAAGTGQEPVAVVGSGFQLCWLGSGPIAPLVERHGIKVGSKLYPAAQAATGAQGQDDVLTELDWCIGNGCYGPRTEKVLQQVPAILARAAPSVASRDRADGLPTVDTEDRDDAPKAKREQAHDAQRGGHDDEAPV